MLTGVYFSSHRKWYHEWVTYNSYVRRMYAMYDVVLYERRARGNI